MSGRQQTPDGGRGPVGPDVELTRGGGDDAGGGCGARAGSGCNGWNVWHGGDSGDSGDGGDGGDGQDG